MGAIAGNSLYTIGLIQCIMSYILDYHVKPLINAILRWKVLAFSMVIELAFILFSILLGTATLKYISGSLSQLSDNSLYDTVEFLKNVSIYNTEIKNFLFSLVLASIVFFVLFLILYSVSRTIIWNMLLKTSSHYLRNLLIDGIFLSVFFIFLYFILNFIKPKFYLSSSLIIFIPLFYYSFFCHLNYHKNGFSKVLASAFTIKMLHFLPCLLVIATFFYLLPRHLITTILFFILLNIFRSYTVEIEKRKS